MKRIFILTMFLMLASVSLLLAQSASATYTLGNIPTTLNWDPDTNDVAEEPGILTVAIPVGVNIIGVDVAYDMTAHNGSLMEYQRSYMVCTSPGGIAEPEIYSGPIGGFEGTYSYSRTDLDIANNVYAQDEITFELHAFRIWGGTGSNTDLIYVVNGTWTVTVHYQSAEFDHDMAAVGISGPDVVNTGQVWDYTITVANFGSQAQDNYTVKLMKEGDIEVDSVVVTVNLETFEAVDVTLSWTPSVEEETYIYGKVVLTGDQNAGNDMTENLDVLVVGAPLEGTYVINHNGTGDYVSFTSAVDYLVTVGVNGPVVFEVAPGTYTEQIQIPEIIGASETNTITFIGSGARNESILFYEPDFTNRHLVMLNGAKYINFENLVFTIGDGALAGNQFQIRNESEYINIIGNVFNSKVTTSSNFVHVIISNSNFWTGAGNSHNIVLEGNIFNDGYAAFRPNGAFANRLTGIEVRNNVVNDAYDYGLYLNQLYAPIVEGNLINTRAEAPTTTVAVGIYLLHVHGPFVIYGNEINNPGQYGIYFSTGQTDPAERSQIVNNSIGGGFRNGGTFSGGMRILGTVDNLDILFNSFNADFGNGTALYIGATTVTGLDIRNNSFANTGGGTGHAMYLQGTVIPVALDYNNYYSNGSNFVFYGAEREDLAALQAVNAPVNNDQNSLQGNPLYTSATNLLPVGPQLYQMGTSIPGIEEDIEGTLRPDPPCIGAYEFAPHLVPVFSVNPSSHDFGLTMQNVQTGPLNVTVTNIGGGNLALDENDIVFTGDDADDFSFSAENLPADLGGGQSVVIPVYFTPTDEGFREALLRMEYDGAYYYVNLSGTAAPLGTYVYNLGDIPSTYNTAVTTASRADQPGLLTINVPDGQRISGLSTMYDVTAQSGAYMSDQRSFLVCAENNTTEPQVYAGTGMFGTFSYDRDNIDIANTLTGEVNIELHLFRTWGGTGTNTEYNYVVNGTWYLIVQTVVNLDTPVVSIEVIDGEAFLTWDAVDGANSYEIFVSDDPYVEFVDWNYQTTVGVPGYTEAVVDEKRFYRVIASMEEIIDPVLSAPEGPRTTEAIQRSR